MTNNYGPIEHAKFMAIFLTLMALTLLWLIPGCKSDDVEKAKAKLNEMNTSGAEWNELFTASKANLDKFTGTWKPAVDAVVDNLGQGGGILPGGDPPPQATTPDSSAVLSPITWIAGYSCQGTPEQILKSVSVKGGKISFSYNSYSWPSKVVEVEVDAVACFFIKQADGSWKGGKFDWIRKGGQGTKGTENITGGYGGHVAPPSGTDCAFVWGSIDGKRQSNPVFCKWQ